MNKLFLATKTNLRWNVDIPQIYIYICTYKPAFVVIKLICTMPSEIQQRLQNNMVISMHLPQHNSYYDSRATPLGVTIDGSSINSRFYHSE